MKNKTSQSGFTLIELIAVMVILGILAAVIIPRISTITSGAYESNVRNMYGLIKNEVNAQAVKAAMSGGAAGHLETYPNPTTTTKNYYLDRWVDDYDPDMWTQFQSEDHYTGQNAETNDAILFMYHPHGQPDAVITWTGADSDMDPGGSTKSLEDIYWIYYSPRTSVSGTAAGRTLDGFVMAAWTGNMDWTFDGSINASGSVANGSETAISDLSYMAGD